MLSFYNNFGVIAEAGVSVSLLYNPNLLGFYSVV